MGNLLERPVSRCATAREPELFRAMPGAADALAWMPLGAYPTPVERVHGLLPNSVELWVKREDQSSEAYGGNKVRKLEFLLGDARARGRGRLATFGGTGSHHVLATAIHGAANGFDVEATLFPQPLDDHVKDLLLADRATGADVRMVSSLPRVLGPMLRVRRRPDTVWLAGGGSSALGTLGWVSGGHEIQAQVREGVMPPPDVVYAAMGSGGTIAGLHCGLRGPRPPELVGVRVVGGAFSGGIATRILARAVQRLLEPYGPLRGETPSLRVDARHLGRGYGYPTEASRAAVRLAASHGLALDPIYTGKVMAALLDDARAGLLAGRRVLFLHSYSHDGWRCTPSPAHSPEWRDELESAR
jgi:D-cysteine desulfhydrase